VPEIATGDVLRRLRAERGLERLDDAATAVSVAAHRLHHALGLGETRVERDDVVAEDLVDLVAENPRRAVVVVDHAPGAVGGDDDVGRSRDQPFERLLRDLRAAHRSTHLALDPGRRSASSFLVLGEPALGVDRGHAARPAAVTAWR
jgi:hypothetical protein